MNLKTEVRALWAGAASRLGMPRRSSCDSTLPVQLLDEGQVQEIERPLGLSLWCVQGRLWLKQEGHAGDQVIQAGETFHAVRAGRLTILALSNACFGVDLPQP